MEAPLVVTGADGFIGRALCTRLTAQRRPCRAVTRASHGDLAIADEDALAATFAGAGAVIHLAGRAHVMDERALSPVEAYRLANVVGTERVARAAVRAGVETFVFASSIKVNGEATLPGRPFRAADAPDPQDDYARSKLAAERALLAIAGSEPSREPASGSPSPGTHAPMRVAILRLPLVYGPGVKGNLQRLWGAVAAHRVLPLGGLDNRRSLLGLDNLIDALLAAATGADHGVYLVADAQSISTPALIRAIAAAQGTRARLLSVPRPLLYAAGSLTGQRAAIERLAGSLEVDSTAFATATGWTARRTLQEGLSHMVAA